MTIATLVLTLLIFISVFLVLGWTRTSHYRLSRGNVVSLLRLVLEGKATENDWRLFSTLPLRHDPLLAQIRERCLEIEEREFRKSLKTGFLFSPEGLRELREILDELEREADAQ